MKRRITPVQFVFISFVLVILTGAVLLTLPISSRSGQFTDFISALFTATSATCVTGLVVVDTYTYWSNFGQLVILLLIQVGGLGYMTIATLFLLGFRKRITLKERFILKEGLNVPNLKRIVLFAKIVLLSTAIVEGTGALIMFFRFIKMFPFLKALWFSVFHAVSAFCNAGFDLMGNFQSLMKFVNDLTINLVIMSLIVIGGIGFIVIREILDFLKARLEGNNLKKLSLHAKIVLTVTSILIISGFTLIFLLERSNPDTLGPLTLRGKFLASMFQSVTPRTAGFATLDIGKLNQATQLIIIFLMFIGASPGGTGGGIKTSTFTVMLLLFFSSYRENASVVIFGRTIPQKTIKKAIFIFGFSLFLVLTSSLLILIAQGKDFTFLQILFEVTSAFGTVGLSTGITPQLSNFSRLVIIATMIIGRVGPLAVILSISTARQRALPQYPEEDIAVG